MLSGPVRACAACRTRRPQNELLRVARSPEGAIVFDGRAGRSAGRGAYVCPDPVCVETAWRSGRLRRTLRVEGPLPAGLKEELLRYLEGGRDG